ncbi:class F sortase [Flexivirga sp. ID2601S]|uniref:Class F sortase n=1 Tax=Flexivirga aerilata TaxID=1656889 RepID=A0A849AED3_9MICO|nr:class F sortase [Flexivirga aerilata]NNG38163.1 class F sortase [Flexivirga aerilata]
MTQQTHAHRRTIGLAVCVLLVVAGIVACLWAVKHRYQESATPPAPSSAASPAAGSTSPPDSTGPSAGPSAATEGFPPSRSGSGPAGSPAAKTPAAKTTVAKPVSVQLPSIGVSSELLHLGLQKDGTVAVPSFADVMKAAWFTGSPAPGADGPAVIEGHVTGPKGPGVFYKLGSIRVGDDVRVTQAGGRTLTFRVYKTERYPKNQFPTGVVYGNTPGPELRVITCGGTFDASTGHFRDNTVVYARLV